MFLMMKGGGSLRKVLSVTVRDLAEQNEKLYGFWKQTAGRSYPGDNGHPSVTIIHNGVLRRAIDCPESFLFPA